MRVFAIITPLYFLAQYVFNAGLRLTSVSNLSSLFTPIIYAAVDVESISWLKLLASSITILGARIIDGVDGRRGHF